MSWKLLATLAILAGLGLGAQVNAQGYLPGRPLPPNFAAPGFAPAGAFCGSPFSSRDLERRISYTLRQHYGHCIDDIDVDVDRRRNHIDVRLEVRRPLPHGQVNRLLYAMPELRGYHVHLRLDRD